MAARRDGSGPALKQPSLTQLVRPGGLAVRQLRHIQPGAGAAATRTSICSRAEGRLVASLLERCVLYVAVSIVEKPGEHRAEVAVWARGHDCARTARRTGLSLSSQAWRWVPGRQRAR